jgi:tRNA-dihydrouridine synthase B
MNNFKLVISPMAGVTDSPFRTIALANGADYGISEMITAQIELWSSNKTQQRLKSLDTQSVKIIQIAGASVEVISSAVINCNQLGLDAIEINMGCPAKKVCNVLAGSALLKDPSLVKDILASAVEVSKIPIHLKTRLGWDEDNQNIMQIAKMAEDVGIKSLAIHGRTREQMYNGSAQYDLIRQVKQQLSIPVFANGDIDSVKKAVEVLEFTQADGLYIGRGALGQPWIFQQIKDKLNLLQVIELDREQKIMIILQHIQLMHQHYSTVVGVRLSRKHLKWYLAKNPDLTKGNLNLISDFMQLESPDAQLEFINSL